MCGIVGVFRPQGGVTITQAVLARMRDRMAHRGPDGEGLWKEPEGRCALGHRRLSIIDLSSLASQPMANVDETVIVTFNGEIYNHREIRGELESLGRYRWITDHSDTEVLLHAYEEWGIDCIHRFRGMFAFAVYDRREPDKPCLHLCRDRVGVKPLYLTKTDKGEWAFASEIKGLLEHPDVKREMDLTAFWHYLTFIVAPAPLSMFRGIFKIPAGWRVVIDHHGNASAQCYWDCRPRKDDFLSESDLSFEEAGGEVMRLLRKSIARRMVSDVPFGVLLSGGVDSSLNVALMSELQDSPVKTFTIGYEEHPEFNEFDHAAAVSRRFSTDHHERRITSAEALDFLPLLVELQDEPIADNVCIPLYFLAKMVRESGTTVVQVGEGADENMLGYWWCDHYNHKYREVYRPSLESNKAWSWRRFLSNARSRLPARSGEDAEIAARAASGDELFWGGAVCWWGELRHKLTPDRNAFRQRVDCPVEGLMPDSHRALDSGKVVSHHLSELTGQVDEPEILRKIPYMEMKLRLPEHLLMRVDKMTMASSVEARVPFLDHELVEFLTRIPSSYKLRDGLGKNVLKKAAEGLLDHDTLYRKKQGFGAPMDKWFADERFGKRCLAAFEKSPLGRDGLIDAGYFKDLLKKQVNGGGYGFHAWTVLNAVLWHSFWIEGRNEF